MSPYKSFISAAKTYLESIPFLKFLLSSYIYVFSLGGLLFLLGSFIVGIYEPFTCIGGIIVFAGLLLTLVREDMLTLVIASGSLSFVSLVAWIVGLVAYAWGPYMFFGSFRWQPFFYFLIFGAVAVVVFVKSERFKQMRVEAAAKSAQMRAEEAARNMVACPRCGAGIPKQAGFCPNCGAPNPAMQYAPPAQPPYAPPAEQQPYSPPAPPYAPPAPPYAPPAPPYAPPAPMPYAPPPFVPAEPAAPAPPSSAAAVPQEPTPTVLVPAEPAAPVPPPITAPAPAVKQCIGCGAELPTEAVFCGKCGTKQ